MTNVISLKNFGLKKLKVIMTYRRLVILFLLIGYTIPSAFSASLFDSQSTRVNNREAAIEACGAFSAHFGVDSDGCKTRGSMDGSGNGILDAGWYATWDGPDVTYHYARWNFCGSNTRYFLDLGSCSAITAIPPFPEPPPCPPCHSGANAQPIAGNPIVVATGAKIQTEIDYRNTSFFKLIRTYDGNPLKVSSIDSHPFGSRWTHNFESSIRAENSVTLNTTRSICWQRSDNKNIFCENDTSNLNPSKIPDAVSVTIGSDNKIFFKRDGMNWQSDLSTNERLTSIFDRNLGTIVGWLLITGDGDETWQYDAIGRLMSVSKRNGVKFKLTYSNGFTNDPNLGRIPVDAPICTQVPQTGAVIDAGKILCITDNWGHQLQMKYDIAGRISLLIDPAGGRFTYSYDGQSGGCVTPSDGTSAFAISATSNQACSANNLTSMTFPDGSKRVYYYNELAKVNNGQACPAKNVSADFGSLVNALTSIVDEDGTVYASWNYDCQGRAISSEHAEGVDKVILTYGTTQPDGSSSVQVSTFLGTVTEPQSTSTNYQFKSVLNTILNVGMDLPCPDCNNIASRTYDANGNVASTTDFKGVVTKYGYDLSRNLETSRTEAAGTALAKTTTTSWHEKFRLPVQINEPLLRTVFIYDSNGNVLTKTQQTTTDMSGSQGAAATVTGAPRVWRYTYNSVGQVLTVTGPRTDVVDVTTYAYDTQGNLTSLTNAAGHVTTMTNYDAHGHVGTITDPNGVVTNLTYAPRGWLLSRSTSADGVTETTTYTYDGVGQMTQVTLPDNSQVHYTYDDAHRLVRITDNVGNSINYILDNMGNRVQETVTDASGNLSRQVSRIYDTLNRLQQVTGATQ
ncbi:DUF6531 domain-containing protein [Undibacterium sp. MH2W]|uniref:DUF6531 domain-containing protein n=1 Tax=Undibacterium sp. MH2W TaxID=3413044 RepID=UPI003BEFCD88